MYCSYPALSISRAGLIERKAKYLYLLEANRQALTSMINLHQLTIGYMRIVYMEA